MNEFFALQLVSSTATKILKVMWIEVQSPTGEFVVGPGHAPLVSIITSHSKLMYKKIDGSLGMFTLPGGILHIENNNAVILLDSPLLA